MSSLHDAARGDDPDTVSTILAQGIVDVNSRDKLSRTPLIIAAWAGKVENVKILLAMGATSSAAAGDDMTGLHFAAQKGHTEVCRILINSGVKVGGKTRKGMNALHFASLGGHADTVDLLLKRKANTTAVNKKGETAENLAKLPDIRKLLRDAAVSSDEPPLQPSPEVPQATPELLSEIGPMPPPSDQQQQLRGLVIATQPGSGNSNSKRNAQRRRRHKPADGAVDDPFVTNWAALAQAGSSIAEASGLTAVLPRDYDVKNTVTGADVGAPQICDPVRNIADVSVELAAQQQQQTVGKQQAQDRSTEESQPDLSCSKSVDNRKEDNTSRAVDRELPPTKKHKTAPRTLVSIPGDDEQE